ncbi:MAG: glycine cleavage system protein GcvH [Chloroflexi bacterium]|nr:glycine cleavage system protein GcvH [Chloroflexota bacterium]MCI0820281.1 glycine cleavage system protein GcvH [Chloroflexota bacterium]MCI0839720.1 glycine cleavage system protein GcvH [Chloroflexota bacterium]MCI0886380.1 glycine cleavage system protein GcvH [Chloroflexota bacterium]
MVSPPELKYTKEHEWVRVEGDIGTIGITDYAQDQLGDIVFVELPAVGATISAAQKLGEIESVKAVSELFAPVSGEVTEANDGLADSPEAVNDDPYGDGWMVKMRLSAAAELDGLLSADEYEAFIEAEDA